VKYQDIPLATLFRLLESWGPYNEGTIGYKAETLDGVIYFVVVANAPLSMEIIDVELDVEIIDPRTPLEI
jgi:hypothetical protein